MQYGYIRMENADPGILSSRNAELESFKPEKIYVDQNAGGEEINPQLTELLDNLQPGDEIIVKACTTLSTDENTLQKIIAKIRNKKASVRFLDLSSHGMENPILRARKAQQTQRWY